LHIAVLYPLIHSHYGMSLPHFGISYVDYCFYCCVLTVFSVFNCCHSLA